MGCDIRRCAWNSLLFLSYVSLFFLPEPAPAQIPTAPGIEAHGQIVVRVKDSDGSPMRLQASVTLRSTNFLTNITMNTTDAAQALFTGLHAGQYVVEVNATGYRTAQAEAIIATWETENVEVTMMPEPSRAEMAGAPGAPVLAPKALKQTEKGLQALQSGKLEEAETHLKRALQLAPGFPDVNYLMGVLWMARHDATQARGYLEKTVQLAPKHAPALLALGEAEYLLKDYAHALESLEQSIDIKPTSWRAHWLAGVASYQLGDYRKSREHAREALQVGQEKAVRARLLLGEAQTALGERDAALATLEQYLREQPNAPQAATAKELIAWLRSPERQKQTEAALTSTAGVTSGVAITNALDNTTVAALPPIAAVTETNWAPPDVDEEKPRVDANADCSLDQLLERTGTRVEELVKNVDRFTATEEMEHESLSPLGVQVARDTRKFDYLVTIRQIGAKGLDVQEYRDGSVSREMFPVHLATLGMPSLALVFHPFVSNEYDFVCEGRGTWRGRAAWAVHFRQRNDRMSEMRVYRVNGMAFPVKLKGRAWIDAENSQILAMEADIVQPVQEIRLLRDYQLIEYGPVEFKKAGIQLWLPKSADWYCSFAGKRYHRRHSFSGFLLFSVDDRQWIGDPKDSRRE